jgi:hypothetical protein
VLWTEHQGELRARADLIVIGEADRFDGLDESLQDLRPVATVVSITGYTARIAVRVTMLALAAKPSSTWRGSQGLRASFSAKQKE